MVGSDEVAPIPDDLHDEWGDDIHEMRNLVMSVVEEGDDAIAGVPAGQVMIAAVDEGFNPEYAEELIQQLLMGGVIYQPKGNRYAVV